MAEFSHFRFIIFSLSAIVVLVVSAIIESWQGQRVSNPQPSVLETDALPIELCPCRPEYDLSAASSRYDLSAASSRYDLSAASPRPCHSMIFATTPAPTVLPPSRMAKRRPCSIAMGVISVTTIFTLSPGITISVPLGSSTAPVTSVVRK